MPVGSKTLLQQAAQDLETLLSYRYSPGKPTLKEYSSAKRTLLKLKAAEITTKVTMDNDDYSCRHGQLPALCLVCEEGRKIKIDAAYEKHKVNFHRENDARALALQMRQPNNGDFV